MNAYGNGNGFTDYAEDYRNGLPPEQRLTIGQAEARIAKLERALADMTKNKNALLAVGRVVISEFEKAVPNHTLAKRANRDKIFDANYRL